MTAPIEGDAPDAFGNAKQRSTRAKHNAPKAAALSKPLSFPGTVVRNSLVGDARWRSRGGSSSTSKRKLADEESGSDQPACDRCLPSEAYTVTT